MELDITLLSNAPWAQIGSITQRQQLSLLKNFLLAILTASRVGLMDLVFSIAGYVILGIQLFKNNNKELLELYVGHNQTHPESVERCNARRQINSGSEKHSQRLKKTSK